MAKDFSKIIELSLNEAKKFKQFLSNLFSSFRSRKITVETEVKGTEKIEEAKQNIDSLGETVKKLPGPPVTLWSKMKGVFSSLYSGISNFGRGVKNITDYLVSSGGETSILADGFKSLVETGNHFRNSPIQRMKVAAMPNLNLSCILPEAAQAN